MSKRSPRKLMVRSLSSTSTTVPAAARGGRVPVFFSSNRRPRDEKRLFPSHSTKQEKTPLLSTLFEKTRVSYIVSLQDQKGRHTRGAELFPKTTRAGREPPAAAMPAASPAYWRRTSRVTCQRQERDVRFVIDGSHALEHVSCGFPGHSRSYPRASTLVYDTLSNTQT